MEAVARTKYVRQSARKIRKTLDLVRGMNVEKALNFLHFSEPKAANVIENTVRSAASNFLQSEEGKNVDPENLFIKEAYVDGGPMMRRFRAASMGRVSRIRRRTSHLTIILSSKETK
tara:strand:+ start:598 stop:948 length:351 start_codon:yes stop_codon:yes gene_type:complete